MEEITTPYRKDGKKRDINGVQFFWNEYMDSERCDSTELNTLIRRQIQQNKFSKEEEVLSQQQTLYHSSLCSHKCFTQSRKQNDISRQEFEHRIQILEKQREELLEVNKQWDQQFRQMKQTYENQALLKATRKEKIDVINTNSPGKNMNYEDLKTEVEVLIQQVQIYEEDFKQERADRERINKEKEELQQINQRLRYQLRINKKVLH
ncbi:TNFAIP3-interacting protein 3 isoform X2 [Pseudophryne corroboree]|uniref:TNFAIP3-interacting protein 3 isoform X2 n=1 Tax=Pseudophryne corroboree TaxID=495146 RepID=UPI0030818DE1